MKKLFAVLLICTSVACGGGSSSTITGNTDTTVSQTPSTPTATTPTPTTVDPTPDPKTWWWEGQFNKDGSWSFKNTSGEPLTWTVFTTNFEDQVVVRSAKTETTGNKNWFEGSLGATCAQIDAIQGVVKVGDRDYGAPFAHGYLDVNGRLATAEAATASCKPTPTPSPSPTPGCEENPEPQTTYGDYSWLETIEQGKCEQEVLPVVYADTTTPALNCHVTGSQSYTTDLKCSQDRTGTRSLCRNVACPTPPPQCVPEYTTRTVKEYTSEWDKIGFAGEACGKRYYDLVKYTLNSCTQQETREVVDNHKREELQCSEACYYTISGEPQGSDRAALCQQASGPKYVNWNSQDNHCIVNLPGVYKDVIPEYEITVIDDKGKEKKVKININFNLVPGQSADACRKGNAPHLQ